jgi:hypothetical protein
MTIAAFRAKLMTWLSLHTWLLDMLIAACLTVLGIGGLIWVVGQFHPYSGAAVVGYDAVPFLAATEPNVPALGLFVAALGVGATGAAWFVVRLIHWRFFAPVRARRVWRQAFFVALFVVGGAWLKINQALTIPLLIALAFALGLIEMFLNTRRVPGDE